MRHLLVLGATGFLFDSCLPRPKAVEIAALNFPSSNAERTEADTSLALFPCDDANITTKKANSSVMKSA